MKNGVSFQMDHKEYVVALCTDTPRGNVALLLCTSGDCDCVTVSNLKTDGAGEYSWDLGYRTGDYRDAVDNYLKRITAESVSL